MPSVDLSLFHTIDPRFVEPVYQTRLYSHHGFYRDRSRLWREFESEVSSFQPRFQPVFHLAKARRFSFDPWDCSLFHSKISSARLVFYKRDSPGPTISENLVELDEIESSTINGIYEIVAESNPRGRNDSVGEYIYILSLIHI